MTDTEKKPRSAKAITRALDSIDAAALAAVSGDDLIALTGAVEALAERIWVERKAKAKILLETVPSSKKAEVQALIDAQALPPPPVAP